MHIYTLDSWKHTHRFHHGTRENERRTRRVIGLTLAMMGAEIAAGMRFGSMALLADGWHMGTHAAALGITALAYYLERRHADNPLFSFGTGKIGILGGYTSAIVLALVALVMAGESLARFQRPVPIRFEEAILVAVVGLAVNLLSAWMLQGPAGGEMHPGAHAHVHPGDHGHHDHNLKAAYLHVLADALTSLLAIAALVTGKFFGWTWMDPAMGLVGAVVILRWAWGLVGETSRILLDRDVSLDEVAAIYRAIETDGDNRVADLHVWRLGPGRLAAVISVVTHFPKDPGHYKDLLRDFTELNHITVEVHTCRSEPCLPPS
jgi:cation diffusion facilitator family transporter